MKSHRLTKYIATIGKQNKYNTTAICKAYVELLDYEEALRNFDDESEQAKSRKHTGIEPEHELKVPKFEQLLLRITVFNDFSLQWIDNKTTHEFFAFLNSNLKLPDISFEHERITDIISKVEELIKENQEIEVTLNTIVSD
ncbi:10989_t:CDS:2, partial [Diversispora eburnea]